MNEPGIVVKRLTRIYRVPLRGGNRWLRVRDWFRPRFRPVLAVDALSFAVEPGEALGLIGPNGAGKTTLLKMLAGLLFPTSGDATVLGYTPWERRPEYLKGISMVMGNRSQLLPDVAPLESFRMLAEIYEVPRPTFARRLDDLAARLDLERHLATPVRNLSLGERRRCELVAGLLHGPSVLFLDEPTIGLDAEMQFQFWHFLREYGRSSRVTILLTSHYMSDIENLCTRVVLVHEGRKLYDGALGRLVEDLVPYKVVRVRLPRGTLFAAPPGVELVAQDDGQVTLHVARAEAVSMTGELLRRLPLTDFSVEDPPIGDAIERLIRQAKP